jgi:hypothetical protein
MWKKNKKAFVSFVEEAVLNPLYEGFVGGRAEVTRDGDDYPSEEIRFLTKEHKSEYYRLRDLWDFKELTAAQLDKLRKDLGELK